MRVFQKSQESEEGRSERQKQELEVGGKAGGKWGTVEGQW